MVLNGSPNGRVPFGLFLPACRAGFLMAAPLVAAFATGNRGLGMNSSGKYGISWQEWPARGSSRELWIREFRGTVGLARGRRHKFAPPTLRGVERAAVEPFRFRPATRRRRTLGSALHRALGALDPCCGSRSTGCRMARARTFPPSHRQGVRWCGCTPSPPSRGHAPCIYCTAAPGPAAPAECAAIAPCRTNARRRCLRSALCAGLAERRSWPIHSGNKPATYPPLHAVPVRLQPGDRDTNAQAGHVGGEPPPPPHRNSGCHLRHQNSSTAQPPPSLFGFTLTAMKRNGYMAAAILILARASSCQ